LELFGPTSGRFFSSFFNTGVGLNSSKKYQIVMLLSLMVTECDVCFEFLAAGALMSFMIFVVAFDALVPFAVIGCAHVFIFDYY
jgi:hypothetical protein